MIAKASRNSRKEAATTPKRASAARDAERAKRQNDLLDEGLRETFPASDPVSVVRLRQGLPSPSKKPA